MDIPRNLIEQIRLGRTVLFLGAGATLGAQTSNNQEPPLADELSRRIAERFLTEGYSSKSLAWVSSVAISASDIFTVQDFIAEQYRDLQPAAWHYLIPTFLWRGIATTNFDCIVETVYSLSEQAVQKVVPFVSNDDRVDDELRDCSSVALLKLHGCVTKPNDQHLPFILTPDQYLTYRDSRDRLFSMLEEWGSENTMVFAGHSLQDSNLQSILMYLTKRVTIRPQYYLVRPDVDSLERELWSKKNISVLSGTFEAFLAELDSAIPKETRILARQLDEGHPIVTRFIVNDKPSLALLEFLDHDFEYVHENIPCPDGTPAKFYSGFGQGWFPIIMGLDVRRGLTDTALKDIIIRSEEDRPSRVELYLIGAEAGAGKSVFLRRLAWEAANDANVLCLLFKGTSLRSLEVLQELSKLTDDRIFLFIDDAVDHISAIKELLDFGRKKKLRITLITAERVNEWNTRCQDLEDYLSGRYQLGYLNQSEIRTLVNHLTEYDSLGSHLAGKSFDEQIEEFEKRADRQLLVALHEATQGRPFEEILLDEYHAIIPPDAQRLYLSVCVLNRLNVPVRAGLISRVHSIPFDQFQKRLFRPLEHVIHVVTLPWGDYAYKARHSEIAQIVFEQVLTDPAERFNEYIRIMHNLIPVYSVDRDALRAMLSAKTVHRLFPNHDDARAIYDLAEKTLRDSAYLLQQKANYERIRPNGNLSLAQKLLHDARQLAPTDATITHTLAEVFRARANASSEMLERTRFRNEALAVLGDIHSSSFAAQYASVTTLNLCNDELRDLLADESSEDRDIEEAIRRAERVLEVAKQKYPANSYVLSAESDLAELLENDERSFRALEHANSANPRDPYISSRLANVLLKRNDIEGALACVKDALNSDRGNKRLNFRYAELLRTQPSTERGELVKYYRRAFTEGDQNYLSQFWYARFLFESNNLVDIRKSKEVFQHLRETPMSYEERIRVRDAIGGLDRPKRFFGTIYRVEATHGFISVDSREDSLFFHESDVVYSSWNALRSGRRVSFAVGFSLCGPKAINLLLEGSVS